ncbi:MAG TPA: nuclear transport factor 2 family protein, partial [Saprospiraceae bacterium]|nr:nuclear transport factor 2 family protein [Saprospiraceae bacterium]
MENAKKKSMISTYRQFMEIGLNSNDPGTIHTLVDKKIFGFGTAMDEKCQGIKSVLKLIEIQREQSQGMNISWRIEPVSHYTTEDGNTAVFADDVYMYLNTNEELFEMYIRFSVILNYSENQWKVIHWHGSKPEQVESQKDTWGIESWRDKAKELELLIAEKTAELVEKNRELEIEAALEKVRSRSLAMHKSEELGELIKVILQKLDELGIGMNIANICIPSKDRKSVVSWNASNSFDYTQSFVVPWLMEDQVSKELSQAYESGMDYFSKSYSLEEKNKYLNNLFTKSDFKNLPEERKAYVLGQKNFTISAAGTKNSWIQIFSFSGKTLSDDESVILKRFAYVFDQCYTRFLDLEKAEAQAREAQIEAALERVRTRAMAMHSSLELKEVITTVMKQLIDLGFDIDMANFNYLGSTKEWVMWLATPEFTYPEILRVPAIRNPLFDRPVETLRQGKSFLNDIISNQDFLEALEHFYSLSALNKHGIGYKNKYESEGKGLARSIVFTKHISLTISNIKAIPYTDIQNRILKRFANVFEQSYTRFLDLEKAEAQAREAQIEIALERVRARAMAMHTSQELKEVVHELRRQMGILGQKDLETCVIHLYDESPDMIYAWAAIKPPDAEGDILETSANIPKKGYLIIEEALEAYYSSRQDYTIINEGEKLEQWLSFLKFQYPEVLNKLIGQVQKINLEDLKSFWSFADFAGGALLMVTRDAPDENSCKLLRRFANVFGLAYRRFADLKKAEFNALEAIRRASIERVRGEIASMRTTEDLQRITPLIWNELTTLGVPFFRCGIFIVHENNSIVDVYLSTPEGKSIARLHLPFGSSELTDDAVTSWRAQQVYKIHWVREDFQAWVQTLIQQGQLQQEKQYMAGEEAPLHLWLHFIPFAQGMLYVGNNNELNEDHLILVELLADAFATAYARYEDFTRLESANQQIEKTLEDLKSTQRQLIQSEKMASLGELTAGIAHEIQNPLNFVN